MDEFTNEEKKRIDTLYGTDFKDIKPDDALLIARWERHKLEMDSEYQAKMNAIKEESAEKLKAAKEQSMIARETLRLKRDAAKAKLKAVENGQTEQN